jgi:hypothetical protein
MFRKDLDEYPLKKLLEKYEELERKRRNFCKYLLDRVARESSEAFKKFNQSNKDGIKIRAFFVRIATYWKGFVWKLDERDVLRSIRRDASEPIMELFTDTELQVIVHKIYHPRWGTGVMNPELPIIGPLASDKEIEMLEQKLTKFLRNELLKTGKKRKIILCTFLPIVYVLRLPETPPTIYLQEFVDKAPCWFICSEAQNIDSGFFIYFESEITNLTTSFTLVNIIYRRYEFWKKIETIEDREGFNSAAAG